MDRARVIEKVAKCFALARAQGASPNEAETALRQARSLRRQYQLEEFEIRASLVSAISVPTGTRRAPPSWLHSLAGTCAMAFDCDYLAYRGTAESYSFKFIGVGVSPELAAYAYSALHQQLLLARREHVAAQTRCKLSTKRRRGQLFAESWISAVHSTVARFSDEQPEDAIRSIKAYLELHHPNLEFKKAKTTPVRGHDSRSMIAGWEQGSSAYLHRAVGGNASGTHRLEANS
ncbi:DUF2786 domain-containing protein [Pseudomonas sp. NPDC088368]|uniref:DUF2786 domain-containing protein n=1 Tax=Pseudomonas sp. NPDC088368 TaxID=3364453 RepID=UPI0037FF6160